MIGNFFPMYVRFVGGEEERDYIEANELMGTWVGEIL